MNKKIKIVIAALGMMGVFLMTEIPAQAQLFSYAATSSNGIQSTTTSSTISSTSSMMSTTPSTTIASTTTPMTTVAPSPIYVSDPMAGYMQLDGLTVISVSSGNMPAQILASSPDYPTQLINLNTNGTTVLPSTVATPTTCEEFMSDNATTGTAITCPIPPIATAPSISTSTITPSSTSYYYNPYTIVVNAATNLLLNNRSSATIGDLTPGDQINVYGYYSNGTIDAEMIRDLSEPEGTALGANTMPSSPSVGATLQNEIDQLEVLVLQLAAELSVDVTSTTTSTMMTTPTTSISLLCPMIPYSSSTTSTISGCVPMSSTSTETSTIYQ